MSTVTGLRNDQRLAHLREQLAGWERVHHSRVEREGVVSSGHPELDQFLPSGGLRGRELIEWFAPRSGCGAGMLALSVGAAVLRGQADRAGVLVVIDPPRMFYPPAAAPLGLDLQRVVVVRPRSDAECVWAWDQALRSTVVGAVWGGLARIDPRDFRRFQLAAETGCTVGLLLRPGTRQQDPSWADVQLRIEDGGSGMVRVMRCKGGRTGTCRLLLPGNA